MEVETSMAEDKKIYYQSVLNPSMEAEEILKKYREQRLKQKENDDE